jgi:hypothetical protein
MHGAWVLLLGSLIVLLVSLTFRDNGISDEQDERHQAWLMRAPDASHPGGIA